ncbi:MAG: glycosyltransferase family 2 protein [Propionibacteriaceae bacterium]|nr:glycosyl transferase family 2 [Propionibacteriaceae bacterium]HBY21813.1 glycosyl transferase family 2 [Propionibacteriaceae bacterium]
MTTPLTRELLVIIPAWNEEKTLPGVLAEIRAALPEADVIVVDDGSQDSTSRVAASTGVNVLTLPINLGVGGAMRAGYVYAAREGYRQAVQVDADGQHDPEAVHALQAAMAAGNIDIVIGARFAGTGDYEAKGPRRWAMSMLSAVLSRATGATLTDTTSGFKLTSRRAIELFARELPAEYLGDTVEALVIASKAGLTVRQVGVTMRPRAGGEPSHSPWKAAKQLLRAMLALAVALTRRTTTLPSGDAS